MVINTRIYSYSYIRKVFTLLLLCIGTCSYAQLWVTDNVTVTVQAGATVTVQGDIQNQNNALIFNGGTIDLSGNWVHNAANNCFTTSAGTVIFNGSNQTIGGTSTTAFNNLTLAGTGTKTLNINTIAGGAYAAPAGVLSLGSRNLDLNSKTITITNPATSAITRTTGFILSETPSTPGYGNILWNIGTGTGSYVFPFGNATTASYLPFTMNITSAGVGSTGSVRVATYPTTTSSAPNNRPLPPPVPSTIAFNGGAENSMNLADRWWPVTVSNYTTNPVSSLTFTYRESEWDLTGGSTNNIVEANLGAQRHNGVSGWVMAPAGVDNPTANTVTINAVNNYNVAWVLVEKNAPLPLELLNFTAALNGDRQTDINWDVTNEDNVLFYQVEKSVDGTTFSFLEKINATGSLSNALTNYRTKDTAPYRGKTFYRLKIFKTNGEISFSPIRVVNLVDGKTFSMSIYPNPAIHQVQVQLSLLDNYFPLSNLNLELIDPTGRIVSQRLIEKEELQQKNITINLDNVLQGYYILKINDGISTFESVKIIVQQ